MMLGVDMDKFWTLNPHDLNIYKKAYELKRKGRDEELWRMGVYVGRSLSTVLGHILDKDSKAEYPEQPFLFENDKRELTEEEKKKQIDAFVKSLLIMEANFNRLHNKGD